MATRALLIAWLASGCTQTTHFDPVTWVSGLRLLTVTADPPEVAAGESTALHAVVVDPQGRDLVIHYSACLAPRGAASGPIEDACQTDPAVLQPIGDGADVRFTMPSLDPRSLGLPDPSGGLYLPVRVDFSAGADHGLGFYRLRLGLGLQPPNQNPLIAAVKGVALPDVNADLSKQPAPQPFDESTPIEVGEREGVRLQAALADGSDEMYLVLDSATTTRMVTEELRVIWYSSAGSFSNEVTGLAKPDTTFKLDAHEPPSGALIDVWVVVTDERGGQAIAHRSLLRR